MFTRRSLLRASSAACVAATLPVRLLAQVVSSPKASIFNTQNLFSYTHGQMTQAAFERQIGAAFHVLLADGSSTKIVLTTVTPLASQLPATVASMRSKRKAPAVTPGFSAVFSVRGQAFPQDSYTVESAVNGPAVIFLVPSESSAATCTAVFT